MATFTQTKVIHPPKYLPIKEFFQTGKYDFITLSVLPQEDPEEIRPNEFDILVFCYETNEKYTLTVKNNGKGGLSEVYESIQQCFNTDYKIKLSVKWKASRKYYDYTTEVITVKKEILFIEFKNLKQKYNLLSRLDFSSSEVDSTILSFLKNFKNVDESRIDLGICLYKLYNLYLNSLTSDQVKELHKSIPSIISEIQQIFITYNLTEQPSIQVPTPALQFPQKYHQ